MKKDDIEIYIDNIIHMLETEVLINGWDANVGVGPGDYAFGDVRIPSDRVSEFIEMLRSIRKDESGILGEEIDKLKNRVEFYSNRCDELRKWQSKMREPERTIVCDILTYGFALPPKEWHRGIDWGRGE